MDTGTLQRPECRTNETSRMKPEEECSDYQPFICPYKLIGPFLRERQDKLDEAQKLLESEGAVVILRSER